MQHAMGVRDLTDHNEKKQLMSNMKAGSAVKEGAQKQPPIAQNLQINQLAN